MVKKEDTRCIRKRLPGQIEEELLADLLQTGKVDLITILPIKKPDHS